MRWTASRLSSEALHQWTVIAVFAALPTVGLVAGPSYAALIYGLAVVRLIILIITERRLPALDRELSLFAALFATWCWASVAWSVDPAASAAAALQMTEILAGTLIFLAGAPLPAGAVDRLFHVMFVATLIGGALDVADRALGYPLQSVLAAHSHSDIATKYNRGIDHLVLVAWPQLAYFAVRGNRRCGLVLAACVATIAGIGFSLAAKVGVAAGLLVLVLAYWRPRVVTPAIAGATVLVIGSLPFVLRMLAQHRAELASHVKFSGLARMEIWDFMTTRVLERPLPGWGFGIAGELPIEPEEFSHYVALHEHSIYPHNQWLELWVETGAAGASIGLGLVLLVLLRVRRLTTAARPFAYATIASALAISFVNFEVKTDSWWAAVTAGAWLLIAVDRRTDDSATPMTRS